MLQTKEDLCVAFNGIYAFEQYGKDIFDSIESSFSFREIIKKDTDYYWR